MSEPEPNIPGDMHPDDLAVAFSALRDRAEKRRLQGEACRKAAAAAKRPRKVEFKTVVLNKTFMVQQGRASDRDAV
eukprot:4170375-Heterocapsa_arctica.AAC.1